MAQNHQGGKFASPATKLQKLIAQVNISKY
jgi:hypothetical protein